MGNWWDKIDFDKLTPKELKMVHDHIAKASSNNLDLPHRTNKMYSWQREFWNDNSRMKLLTAGNQCGKSYSQIRKEIEVAGNKDIWPSLWDMAPTHGWYLYPDKTTLDIEFNEKWLPLMPGRAHTQDRMSSFHWKRYPKSDSKCIEAIEWGSGFTTYFFTYTKRPSTLQAQSVFRIASDEELPDKLYSELQFRLSATKGYFSMVFTATLGQELWRKAMQPEAYEDEVFPDAWKRTISQYDCLYFEDGSPGLYTPEMIETNIRNCKSQAEVERRVFGRFVVDSNRLIPTFEAKKHVIPKAPIDPSWQVRAAVDMGSGGKTGHPAAILFLATDPKQKPTRGKFFLGWRGTAGYETTAGDVYERFRKMRDSNDLKPIRQIYDHESAEFRIIASRHNDPFTKANKSREEGISLINTLFKYEALEVMLDAELGKLVAECTTARPAKSKTSKTGDDLIDAARYLVMDVLWDMEAILGGVSKAERAREKALPVGKGVEISPDKTVRIDEDERQKKLREDRIAMLKGENRSCYEQEFEEFNAMCDFG